MRRTSIQGLRLGHGALRIVEFLKTVDIFSHLTPIELTNVAEKITKRQFVAGDVVIRQGESGEEFYLISDGTVDVMREGHEVAQLGSGDFFGEAALITGEPRNATVVANDNVETYVLAKAEFQAAIEASRSFRDQLYRVYFLRH